MYAMSFRELRGSELMTGSGDFRVVPSLGKTLILFYEYRTNTLPVLPVDVYY